MTATPPALRFYEGNHLHRVALPLGGIGTGTVSFGGRGDLRDFELANQPAKGLTPHDCLLALRTRDADGRLAFRALEGPLPDARFEGPLGATASNAGMPRFRTARCGCAYPFAQVELSDPAVPLEVRLEAWNPLVPGDADASAWPVAALRVVLSNPGAAPVEVALLATHRNWIGGGGEARNEERRSDGLTGVVLSRSGGDANARGAGTLVLAMPGAPDVRTGWLPGGWQRGRQQLWREFLEDGRVRPQAEDQPEVASLSLAARVESGASVAIPVYLCWHFPNRYGWPGPGDDSPAARVGNHYCGRFADAWDVATRFHAQAEELEARSRYFVETLSESDIPEAIVEAALANLSTLRSPTVFRLPGGELCGYEGSGDLGGCCPGSCTHVWNYEAATPFLFADLARSMREVEFLHATGAEGLQSFRVGLPLGSPSNETAAADGQPGTLVKLYREWRLCGDDAWLRRLWPAARRALEFFWLPGSWDADGDGVMEGCQHNTMDVEYYGPNPQMQGWYLAALSAVARMASHLGEAELAERCDRLREAGARWTDEHLFNGDYYEHEVRPRRLEDIRPGLRSDMGPEDPLHPSLQLGRGCLIDQLVGPWMARICGLEEGLDPDHVRRTLESVLRHNRREGLEDHVNPMRVYALADETGLLMASYPRGDMPERPFPYHSEVMTGFEYVVATHCIYTGLTDEGLRVIRDVRARYDGRRRSPFDEAECGHHYVRAMASWAGVLAWTGFHYDAVAASFAVKAAPSATRWFWSNGSAWGSVSQEPDSGAGRRVALEVAEGRIRIARLAVGDRSTELAEPRTLGAGERLELAL